jgi:hypothetical protein
LPAVADHPQFPASSLPASCAAGSSHRSGLAEFWPRKAGETIE